MPGDPLALRTDLVDLGQDLGQGDQAPHRARGLGWRDVLGPVGKVLHAVHHADGQRLAARRTAAFVLAGLAGRQTDVAVAVPVEVVLALLGEELQRALVPLPRLQRPAEREVVQLGVEDAHLPPQLLRRMGVGVGHQPEAVERRHPPVHRRIGGKSRLDREDVPREVPVALVDGVEAGLRAEGGEPRRPDVGGDQVRPGTRFKGDLEQVPGVEPQDRPPVRVQVAYPGQAVDHPVGGFEVGGVDQVVDLPGPVELLVDGRDLDRKHEPDRVRRAPARRRQPLLDEPLQVRAQAKEPRLGGHELLLELGPPRRVGEVAGGDDADALLAGPEREVLQVAVPAGRARVLGVDVEVGVERHAAGFPSTASGRMGVRPTRFRDCAGRIGRRRNPTSNPHLIPCLMSDYAALIRIWSPPVLEGLV